MNKKHLAGAAAIAASLSMSALTAQVGPANAAPLQPPPCNGPNCQPPPSPGGPETSSENPAPANSPSPSGSSPSSPTPSSPESSSAEPGSPESSSPAPANPQQPGSNNPAQPSEPGGAFERGNPQVGGPTDAPHGFSTPGHGAPPPPAQNELGWNDGPAPGGPPPNWDGPPPPGGWNGPPPPGGWNSRYDGPPRDIANARDDFGPFDYDGFRAIPVFNPEFGGWGFWYFGTWIPLY